MKRLAFLLVLIGISVVSQAQSSFPYKLSLPADGAVLAGSLGLNIWGNQLYQRVTPYTLSEWDALSTPGFWQLDAVTRQELSFDAQRSSNYLLYGSLGLPVLFSALKQSNKHLPTIGVMYLETVSITMGLTSVTKSLVQRPRPYVFYTDPVDPEDLNDPDPEEEVLKREDLVISKSAKLSFFSGHTSMSAASTFFAAKVFHDLYPESKWRTPIWIGAATIPALTGYLRIQAGKHYLSDVAVGYVVGAAIGILTPQFHKKKSSKKPQLTLFPGYTPHATTIGAHITF